MAEIEAISDALPPGWKVSKDQNGNQYYYNKDLNVTQWSRPEFSGGGGGVAVGQGGGVERGGSRCLEGGGMGGGDRFGGRAVGLDTAAIQMQMLPMPQMFQHVHVPVERAGVVNSGNAMRGGVVGRVYHSAAAQAMLKALSVNTSKDRASEPVTSPTPHVPIPPMSAPLKPSYRDLSICLGMRFRGGGAEAAAGARQGQKCSQTCARKPQRGEEECNQGIYQGGVDGFWWQCPTRQHSEPAHHDARMSLCVLLRTSIL